MILNEFIISEKLWILSILISYIINASKRNIDVEQSQTIQVTQKKRFLANLLFAEIKHSYLRAKNMWLSWSSRFDVKYFKILELSHRLYFVFLCPTDFNANSLRKMALWMSRIHSFDSGLRSRGIWACSLKVGCWLDRKLDA